MNEARTILSGKSYTGKTARMLWELRDDRRVLLVDPKCAQLTELKGWEHVWPSYDPQQEGLLASLSLPLVRALGRSSFRVVAHVRAHHREVLERLSMLATAAKNLTLAVDELMLFIPAGPQGSLLPNTTAVIVSGTHDGIVFVGTTQAVSSVHITVRRIVQRMLIYRTDERSDLALLSNYLPEWCIERLPSLPDFACLDWSEHRPVFLDGSYIGKLLGLLPKERSIGSPL